MTKKSGYRLKRDKDNKKPVPYHQCKPMIDKHSNNVYPYCIVCGRAMGQIPVSKLIALAREKEPSLFTDNPRMVEPPTLRDSADTLRKLDQETPGVFQGKMTEMVDDLLGVVEGDIIYPSGDSPIWSNTK